MQHSQSGSTVFSREEKAAFQGVAGTEMGEGGMAQWVKSQEKLDFLAYHPAPIPCAKGEQLLNPCSKINLYYLHKWVYYDTPTHAYHTLLS